MIYNECSRIILGCAFRVHTALGPGLLESTYEACLVSEMEEAGLHVQRQVPVPLVYKDVKLECGYRLDLLVEKSVIIEIKAVEALTPVHFAQTLTYLKLAKLKMGLLINFNVVHLKEGVRRIANGL